MPRAANSKESKTRCGGAPKGAPPRERGSVRKGHAPSLLRCRRFRCCIPKCVRVILLFRRNASAFAAFFFSSARSSFFCPPASVRFRSRPVRSRPVRSRSLRSCTFRSRSLLSRSLRSRSLRSRSLRSRLHLPISFTVATDDDCVEREKFLAPAARAANTPHNKLKFFRKCDTICCILASHTVL